MCGNSCGGSTEASRARNPFALATAPRPYGMPDDYRAARAIVSRGISAWERDDFESALDTFQSVLADFPYFADVQNKAGLCLAMLGRYDDALEHFEKGLVADPGNIELLIAFAELLQEHFDNADRAAKLAAEALYWLERQPEPDEKKLKEVERLLAKLDPKRRTLGRLQEEMAVAMRGLVERYGAAGLDLMVMDVSWRGAAELGLDDELHRLQQEVVVVLVARRATRQRGDFVVAALDSVDVVHLRRLTPPRSRDAADLGFGHPAPL